MVKEEGSWVLLGMLLLLLLILLLLTHTILLLYDLKVGYLGGGAVLEGRIQVELVFRSIGSGF